MSVPCSLNYLLYLVPFYLYNFIRWSVRSIPWPVVVGSLLGASPHIKTVERSKAAQVARVWSCNRHRTRTGRSCYFLPNLSPAWSQYPWGLERGSGTVCSSYDYPGHSHPHCNMWLGGFILIHLWWMETFRLSIWKWAERMMMRSWWMAQDSWLSQPDMPSICASQREIPRLASTTSLFNCSFILYYVQRSSCHNHKAVNQTNTNHTNLEATGIGTTACARHGCFIPTSIVDFQKGEWYVFLLCQSMMTCI